MIVFKEKVFKLIELLWFTVCCVYIVTACVGFNFNQQIAARTNYSSCYNEMISSHYISTGPATIKSTPGCMLLVIGRITVNKIKFSGYISTSRLTSPGQPINKTSIRF